ncbi:MAG: hypothetical protein H7837_13220 [Magnetococcus sp. MYC-9]
MTTHPIIESGMTFGPYPAGQCFHIEKSASYKRIQSGVQMAEFLLLRDEGKQPSVVWVVEAKSSSPRSGTQPRFDHFIDEIRTKLTNGFLLGMAMCLGRHSGGLAELPVPFTRLDLKTSSFRFILVIHGHKDEWLPPLQDAMSSVLKPVVSSWALPPTSVTVLNESGAQRCGLIVPMAEDGNP